MRFRRVAAVLAAGLLVYLTFLAWAGRQGGGEAWTGPTSVPTSEPGIDPVLIERLEASTVSVRGLDCRSAQFGTGFVVAEDLIATGAHVVAGIAVPIVVIDGREVPTRVVAFDPVSDLALLKPTSDLDLPAPLALGAPAAGVPASILVRDEDGRPQAVPAIVLSLIRATGDDIYGMPGGGRDAMEVEAYIRSGHSGAPVVDGDGAVIGILFSRLRGGGPVAYAVQSGELVALIEESSGEGGPAGPCR